MAAYYLSQINHVSFRFPYQNFVCICHFELCDLHSSPNTIRVIKLRQVRWAGHVAGWVEGKGVQSFCGKALREETTGGPGRRYEETITCVLKRGCGRGWAGLSWLRKGTNYQTLYCPTNAHKL